MSFTVNVINMEQINKLINFLIGKPLWLRIAYILAIALLTFLFTCCGSTTKATIRHADQGSTTSVTITTNNPTNWQVTPDVSLNKK